MIRRTVIIDFSFSCCVDEKYRHIDHTVRIKLNEEGEEFETALVVWKDQFLDSQEVKDKTEYLGDNKCSVIDPSLEMCRRPPYEPEIFVVDYYEEIEEIPVVVPIEIIEAIKGYEKSSVALRDSAEKLRAIPSLREDFIKRSKELEQKAIELRIKYGLV